MLPFKAYSRTAGADKLKAIYLVHISKLTTWPEFKEQANEFSICINESSDISTRLQEIDRHIVKNKRPLKIQYDLSLPKLIECDVFYVTADDISIFKKFRPQLESHSVLTVSSEEDFLEEEGGIIRYYPEDNKVKMAINLENMRKSNLVMSSKLLRLMKIEP